MKQYFKSILKSVILSAAVLFTSCEEELTIFKGPYHVRFSSASSSVNENATTATTVKLHFAGPAPKEAISIEYSVSGGTAGTDFTLTGGSALTIPAGEFFTSFTVAPINNLIASGNKVITFEITSVSGGNTAGLGLVGKKFAYTIVDDDCAFDRSEFVGTYDVLEPGYGTYEVSSAEDPDDANAIIIDNFWDFGGVVRYVFDPNTNQVTLPTQDVTMGETVYVVEGSAAGTYEACTGKFVVPYFVKAKATGSILDDNIHTFTKQ